MKNNKKIFIIAEAGVNHNGNLEIAKRLVDAARKAGADAVKFQTFNTEKSVSPKAATAGYQKKAMGKKESQFAMLKKLELDETAHKSLVKYCKKRKIMFLSSPFDIESVELLKKLGLKIFKIPSGEITNLPYLRAIAGAARQVIMSTGMAGLKEVKEALRVLVDSGVAKKNITVLHCTSEYPAAKKSVNLRAMLAIRDKLNVRVGYSDHTAGIEIPVAASAMGAEIIEKHLTLDRDMKGPDHAASLETEEFGAMVRAVRNTERALGNGKKCPGYMELGNRKAVRKSIVARVMIKKGDRFTENNITVKRPAGGIDPMNWDEVLGRKAGRDFLPDEIIAL